MEYVLAFDPHNRVLRITFGKTLTEANASHAYEAVKQFTSTEGSVIYGMARMFGSLRGGMKGEYHVVHTMEEAYALIGISSLDFSIQL